MKALIDGDILVYRIGYASMDVPVGIAVARLDEKIQAIVAGSGASEYQLYLTSADKSNFRFDLYPEYKGNRKQPKPTWYHELRAHMMSDHNAVMVHGQEADDQIGIDAKGDFVICSIDKDLDQIPGKHYDLVKEVQYEVSEESGERFFYFQLLAGDTVDNIPGVRGIGPAKAAKALEGLSTKEQYEKACLELYQKVYGLMHGLTYMILYGRLLKIRQYEEEPLWEPVGVLSTKENVADSKH